MKCIERKTSNLEYFSSFAILFYVAINALREIHQLLQQRWQYLMDPTNLASWLLYLSATLMVLPLSAEQIQVPCAAITVFLSWFTLLLNLQRYINFYFKNNSFFFYWKSFHNFKFVKVGANTIIYEV